MEVLGGCNSNWWGFPRLNESFSCVDAPGVFHRMFTDIERQIGNAWEEVSVEEMETVAVEEKGIAIETGESSQG